MPTDHFGSLAQTLTRLMLPFGAGGRGGFTHQGPTFLRQLSGKIAIDVLHTLVTALDDDLDRELLE